jgi:microcin C transport system substrate-binding protein
MRQVTPRNQMPRRWRTGTGRIVRGIALASAMVAASIVTGASAAETYVGHGIAMHGDLKYKAGFKHFDYVNLDAPKSGTVTLGTSGGYDSFNSFIVKGRPAAGIQRIYDTLMESSEDEPFSMYGVLAETIEVPEDRSWVIFTLREEARWHDGKPVTADDLIWSFNFLLEKGHPYYRYYYGSVDKVEKLGPRKAKFHFKPGENRELPLILGQLEVFPKHYWETRDPTKTMLKPPLGSGPYRVKSFEANRKRHNFDEVRYEYFRDSTVALEAFLSGRFDFRMESSSKAWATAYDTPALKKGDLIKHAFKHERTQGMQGFVFNLRRPIFQDILVRKALTDAFDFEWSNKTLFYGQYIRTTSYFDNSELKSPPLPTKDELKILEPYRDKLPKEVFSEKFTVPVTDGSGNNRANLRKARNLLREAGWKFDRERKQLIHGKTGRAFAFEVLLVSPLFERVVLPFKKNLERLGITVNVRTVDSAQYQEREQNFDFDMIVTTWGQSSSPGNEQRLFWSSDAAGRPGSRNLAGIKNPVVDALVEQLIAAPTRESLVTHTHALDRVLLWQYLVIPHWHTGTDRIAYWNKFGIPKITPKNGVSFSSWWVEPAKAAALKTPGAQAPAVKDGGR